MGCHGFLEDEYIRLCKVFNAKPVKKSFDLVFENGDFFERTRQLLETERRGEVVFAVIRKNGRVVMTRCKNYPHNIYRIPTGGLKYGEDIIAALHREIKEELGITAEVVKFGGVVQSVLTYGDSSCDFYSYVFILREKSGNILVDAMDDEISEIKEVNLKELNAAVESLNEIKNTWKEWGKFRYITSKYVYNLLMKNKKELLIKP